MVVPESRSLGLEVWSVLFSTFSAQFASVPLLLFSSQEPLHSLENIFDITFLPKRGYLCVPPALWEKWSCISVKFCMNEEYVTNECSNKSILANSPKHYILNISVVVLRVWRSNSCDCQFINCFVAALSCWYFTSISPGLLTIRRSVRVTIHIARAVVTVAGQKIY